MRILSAALVILALPAVADISKEEKAQADARCQYVALISSSTQQVRLDYLAEKGHNQAWEVFFDYVLTESNIEHDEGLKRALEISKNVFFNYKTETLPETVMSNEYDKCIEEFILSKDKGF